MVSKKKQTSRNRTKSRTSVSGGNGNGYLYATIYTLRRGSREGPTYYTIPYQLPCAPVRWVLNPIRTPLLSRHVQGISHERRRADESGHGDSTLALDKRFWAAYASQCGRDFWHLNTARFHFERRGDGKEGSNEGQKSSKQRRVRLLCRSIRLAERMQSVDSRA